MQNWPLRIIIFIAIPAGVYWTCQGDPCCNDDPISYTDCSTCTGGTYTLNYVIQRDGINTPWNVGATLTWSAVFAGWGTLPAIAEPTINSYNASVQNSVHLTCYQDNCSENWFGQYIITNPNDNTNCYHLTGSVTGYYRDNSEPFYFLNGECTYTHVGVATWEYCQ